MSVSRMKKRVERTNRIPETGGEALKALRAHYGVERLGELSHLSDIPRSSLVNWREKPSIHLTVHGREHLRRIFLGVGKKEEPMLALVRDISEITAALLAEVKSMREEINRLKEGKRHEQTVSAW